MLKNIFFKGYFRKNSAFLKKSLNYYVNYILWCRISDHPNLFVIMFFMLSKKIPLD